METGDIDWGIEDTGAAEIDISSVDIQGITLEDSGMAGGVAKGNEALTVLDNPVYREQFLDELFEVMNSCISYLIQENKKYFLFRSWKPS